MQNSDLKKKLTEALAYLDTELSKIRAGRVTPELLDTVKVEAYGGAIMTIKELGTVGLADANTLQVVLWDKGLVEAVEKAIRKTELNLNPVVKSGIIIVPVPPLTEERRKELAKAVTVRVEEQKNTLRRLRQEAIKEIETAFSNKEFGEDDKFAMKDEVEGLVKEYVAKAEQLGEEKKNRILG